MTITYSRWSFCNIFYTIEKVLAGRKKKFRRPHAFPEPYVVQACSKDSDYSLVSKKN